MDPVAALRRLERLRSEYGGGAAARKLALLETLERRRLPRAAEVSGCRLKRWRDFLFVN